MENGFEFENENFVDEQLARHLDYLQGLWKNDQALMDNDVALRNAMQALGAKVEALQNYTEYFINYIMQMLDLPEPQDHDD